VPPERALPQTLDVRFWPILLKNSVLETRPWLAFGVERQSSAQEVGAHAPSVH